MKIARIDAQAWNLTCFKPFVIAQRSTQIARNVLIRVETDEGAVGWGECAPVEYVTGETQQSVLEQVRNSSSSLLGQSCRQIEPLMQLCASQLPNAPAARAGLEIALTDLWTQAQQIPFTQVFGPHNAPVRTDLTIPIVPPRDAAKTAAAAAMEGLGDFKIKLGDPAGTEADRARILAVLDAAPRSRLRLDANQAFTPEQAIGALQSLAQEDLPIDLVEQPVAKDDFAGMKQVRDHSPYPIYADESAADFSKLQKMIQMKAIDGVNLKIMKSGLQETRRMLELARAEGMGLMLGCMLESPLALSVAVSLAAGTAAFDFIDLDSHMLLAPVEGLVTSLQAKGPELTAQSDKPGLGAYFHETSSAFGCR